MNSVTWFLIGILAGALAVLALVVLWRAPADARRAPWWRYALPLFAAVMAGGAMTVVHMLRADPPTTAAVHDDMQQSHAGAIEDYRRRVEQDPRDATAWETLAGLYRQQRDYEHARDAFEHLASIGSMSADSWADYADVQASLSGSLAGAPAASIDKALALDPQHAKALWLKASLAHQQGDEAMALSLWTRLRAVLPADSSDARLVDDNIAEARRLAGKN
jgi:cytochrome c-type biogenesis protein CcmH